MEKITTLAFTLEGDRSVDLKHGWITVSDSTPEKVTILAGAEAIIDAVADLLPCCDRSTQQLFIDILTSHIRKTEGEA
tara:strand:+ start:92 stop:325 length:234 start_codon:yes stop_codon:yes gene_type:complete